MARGRLATPVALVTAQSGADGAFEGRVLFVASADDAELRAFLPGAGLFVRGPNAISPLSIPMGFRPQRLASGLVQDRGFVVAAGGARALVTVSSDSFRVTKAAGDEAACAQALPAASCLPEPAIDVSAGGGRVVAALGGSGSLALLTPTLEEDAPVLVFDTLLPLGFVPTAVTVSTDGSRAWVSESKASRIVEVELPAGTMRDIAVAAPARKIVEVPAYTDALGVARPAGEYLLAILVDGRMQTLDPASGAPAPSPLDASEPMVPLEVPSSVFVQPTPILDLVFMPCPGTESACVTKLRRSGSRTDELPLIAMASLGDGTVLPLVPVAETPQVFLPLNDSSSGPSASTPAFSGTFSGTATTLSLDASLLTLGVTRRESVTVTFRGALPGVQNRPATLSGQSLEDAQADLEAFAEVGDSVSLRFLGTGCPAPMSVEVTGVSAGTLSLAPAAELPEGCTRVLYTLVAGAEAPWTVVGGQSGFVGRARTGVPFVYEGRRYAYLGTPAVAGPAFGFTIEGDEPKPGSLFTFNTASGLAAFTLLEDVDGLRAGLAQAVVGLPGRLYVTATGDDSLISVKLAEQGLSGSTVVFR